MAADCYFERVVFIISYGPITCIGAVVYAWNIFMRIVRGTHTSHIKKIVLGGHARQHMSSYCTCNSKKTCLSCSSSSRLLHFLPPVKQGLPFKRSWIGRAVQVPRNARFTLLSPPRRVPQLEDTLPKMEMQQL